MSKNKTTEQRVADTILQRSESIRIGKRTYHYPKPTMATLIELSAVVSKLPKVAMDSANLTVEVLRNGKDCAAVSEAIAVLLVGSRRCPSVVCRWVHKMQLRRTAFMIAHRLSPYEVLRLAKDLLGSSDVEYFFGLTAFLCEINLTKPTKAETTVHGQQ